MRVLQIHKTFRLTGGADTFFFKTGDLLTERGHDVAYFSTSHPENRESVYSTYFVNGFTEQTVKSLGWARKTKAFLDGIYSFEATKRLTELVQDFKPDIAHVHSFNYQLSPSIFDVFRNSRVPLVVTLHDYHLICGAGTLYAGGAICERCRHGRHYNLLTHSCYWNLPASLMATISHYIHDLRHSWDVAARFISPSHFLQSKLVEFGVRADRVVYIPIFIDFSEEPFENACCPEYILYFGRLAENKGIEVLLKAVSTLDCKLLLIGEGPLTNWVEDQCAMSGGKIERIPFVSSRRHLREYIERSAFSIIPSLWYENQPATILETYAAGRPVIGSRLGGIPELIDEGQTGLLFEPGDAYDLGAKIRFMLQRRDICREWGRNGNRKLRKEFSRDSHYNRLIELYESVLTAN